MIVKPLQPFICRLDRRTDEVRRDALPSAFELPLVKESQARRKICDDGCGLVHSRREGRSCSRLVMVFEEPCELGLVIEPGAEMLAHRSRLAFSQPVVEAFVVGVVEALLVHRPFEIPIDLCHEAEA